MLLRPSDTSSAKVVPLPDPADGAGLLSRVFSPVGEKDSWGRIASGQAFLISRAAPNFYTNFFRIAALDEFLAMRPPHFSRLSLHSAKGEISRALYTKADDRVDYRQIAQLLETGASIILSQMQEMIADLADLCRESEALFERRCQANIYWSPPDAQCLPEHADDHDVIILQLAGTKKWTLRADFEVIDGNTGQGEPAQVEEFILEAGDLLYCPRGIVHRARTLGGSSLHVSLGIEGIPWRAVVKKVLEDIFASTPVMNDYIPLAGSSDAAFEVALNGLRVSLVQQLGDRSRLINVLEDLRSELPSKRLGQPLRPSSLFSK